MSSESIGENILAYQGLFGIGVGLGLALPAFIEILSKLDTRIIERSVNRLNTLKNSGDTDSIAALGAELNNFRFATASRFDNNVKLSFVSLICAVLNSAFLGWSVFQGDYVVSFILKLILSAIAMLPIFLGIYILGSWHFQSYKLRRRL